jgi:hypothetical protein
MHVVKSSTRAAIVALIPPAAVLGPAGRCADLSRCADLPDDTDHNDRPIGHRCHLHTSHCQGVPLQSSLRVRRPLQSDGSLVQCCHRATDATDPGHPSACSRDHLRRDHGRAVPSLCRGRTGTAPGGRDRGQSARSGFHIDQSIASQIGSKSGGAGLIALRESETGQRLPLVHRPTAPCLHRRQPGTTTAT